MYVYVKSESSLWTVGFYDPNGRWHSDSDHGSKTDAADRVAYLNGSSPRFDRDFNEALNRGDGAYRP